jgi:D-glycero-D-manno-heptose 1,7-bisphosphate phosphatase
MPRDANRTVERTSRRGLFLDRDGTLCVLVPYLKDPARVKLLPGAGTALARAHAAGWRLVIITNQSGIARGLMTSEDVDAVHAAIDRLLAAHGVAVAGYFICPHHPDLTGPCACRKPAPGLLEKAARTLGLDLERSALVGDTVADVQAGAAAGCQTFLVRTGYGSEQAGSRSAELPAGTRIVADLDAAVSALLADQEREDFPLR